MIKELVVSGGTMKGVFAGGALYEFGLQNIYFEKHYGLSIGGGNLAVFLNKKPELLKELWLEGVSDGKFIKKKGGYDIDDLLKTTLIPHALKENIQISPQNFFAIVTESKTGDNVLMDMHQNENFYNALKAAASIRFFTKKVEIDNKLYYDSCCSIFDTSKIVKNDFLHIRSSKVTKESFLGKVIDFVFGTKEQKIKTPYTIEPDNEYVGYMTDDRATLEKQFEHGREKAREFIKKHKSILPKG